MKKIASKITPFLIAAALFVVPLGVQAQGVVDVTDDTPPQGVQQTPNDALPETGAAPTVAPDTGFAPTENKVVANISVFTIGSLMGIALGYGIVFLKKKLQNN